MRQSYAVLALCFLPSLALSFEGGQERFSDPKTTEQQHFWPELYASGGTSLFCEKGFEEEGGLFVASAVYTKKQIKSSLRCLTDNQCSLKSGRYGHMLSDLHNLYPALSRVELTRRNAQFGELSDSVPSKFADIDCELRTTFQVIEPRDGAKGNIARAVFYMHREYGLPIVGQEQMLKRWHQLDPVDDEERARNDKIESIQGNRNRFIDNPELVNELVP
ncbi:endonuclease I family protein [Atopomonas sediminilitoris]|uniref:endonuclease I family protein n=1 Tax=Atopomonas sediminilitoris TaxID=2919919 RepID=UPI001F4D40B5|nr:endonuclease [Atopomonas sediminilitoris]MCJ8170338.1 endonuclease [Atopomonas sediminilitoris]